jgi:hypothetical protein
MWDQLIGQAGTGDRIDRVLALTERLQKIQSASNTIRYDEQLSLEIPDVLKTLGDAKEAVIAELKIV